MRGKKRSGGCFGQLYEIFPAVGIAPHLPHDTLHLFIVNKAVKSAHTMALDEGNHVISYRCEIVGNGRHILESCKPALYAVSHIRCQRRGLRSWAVWELEKRTAAGIRAERCHAIHRAVLPLSSASAFL